MRVIAIGKKTWPWFLDRGWRGLWCDLVEGNMWLPLGVNLLSVRDNHHWWTGGNGAGHHWVREGGWLGKMNTRKQSISNLINISEQEIHENAKTWYQRLQRELDSLGPLSTTELSGRLRYVRNTQTKAWNVDFYSVKLDKSNSVFAIYKKMVVLCAIQVSSIFY